MTGKTQRPPAGEPFVWLTRELLASDAWRMLGINACRFVHFLMLEHMSKGGQENGKLKAPCRQLCAFGIGARYVTAAIREAEELGVVDCHRGGVRIATTYTLNWLPRYDGTLASNRWRAYRKPGMPALPASKIKNLHDKGKAGLPDKGKADGPNLPDNGKAHGPENLPDNGKALSRKFLPGRVPRDEIDVAPQRAPSDTPLADEPASLTAQRLGGNRKWIID
jgi:hypothetical protein